MLAFYGKSHYPTNDNVFEHAEHIIISFMQSSIEKLNDKINENAECTLLLSKEKNLKKCNEDTIKVNNLLYNSKILKIFPDNCFSEYYMKAEQYFQSQTFKIKERKLWPEPNKRKMEFPFMEGIALSKNNSLGYGRQIENDFREKICLKICWNIL